MASEGVSRFDWDRHNIGHVARHKVKPQEFEQVLSNGPILIETEIDDNSGEERITEIGHTDTGRILFVVWTPRQTSCRPITAYPADPKTCALYIRARFRKDYE